MLRGLHRTSQPLEIYQSYGSPSAIYLSQKVQQQLCFLLGGRGGRGLGVGVGVGGGGWGESISTFVERQTFKMAADYNRALQKGSLFKLCI